MRSIGILFILLHTQVFGQYISEVLEYTPAPGQWVNEAPWGVPSAADPESATSIIGRTTGSMTLGFFGGYTVFRFENQIDNHPDNPYGIDFVLYGNPHNNQLFPSRDDKVSFSEPGIVSVMKDENGNGKADDTWYELAGCDYYYSTTIKNYSVTYTNPKQPAQSDVPFVDMFDSSGVVQSNGFHKHTFYPKHDLFSHIGEDEHTYTGTVIEHYVDVSNPTLVASFDRPWGYADNSSRAIYNGLPDNPYTYETTEGSGGDAFDLHWAVDEDGNYVELDAIDFIRVHTGIISNIGWMGEGSTELTGGFDVSPDASVTGETDMLHIRPVPNTIYAGTYQLEAFVFKLGRWQRDAQINWDIDVDWANIDQNNTLTFTQAGTVTIKASIADKPNIATSFTVNTSMNLRPAIKTEKAGINCAAVSISPNPCVDILNFGANIHGLVQIIDIYGNICLSETLSGTENINTKNLLPGFYSISINTNEYLVQENFIKL